ncbi:MAG TPA: hypothetical protein VGB30_04515 [bacterium]|jgi:hypothetical protein
MRKYRLWALVFLFVGLVMFWPRDEVQSKQYFDATIRFNPQSGTRWHYFGFSQLSGDEIMAGKRSHVGGIIWTLYDEEINSSGNGLVGTHLRYNAYESLDLSYEFLPEDPSGGVPAPDFSVPVGHQGGIQFDDLPPMGVGQPYQSAGGGGGGSGGGGGGGGDDTLLGEGGFELVPIIETDINFTMSESGRMLDIGGLDVIGDIADVNRANVDDDWDILDPSRAISVRQVFQTTHPIVLPDYEVHLNESWRAPFSWTVPFIGATMEIPMTYTLADIRTTYRFRMAAIDFSGILQFGVDVSDENISKRKESHIDGDIIIQGRAYVDLDRGILVAITDFPQWGTPFVDGHVRGHEAFPNPVLNPGFIAQLNFERRDLYTPLGNVLDPRQEVVWRIQELTWFTTTVVE